jgi:hypothetical protein
LLADESHVANSEISPIPTITASLECGSSAAALPIFFRPQVVFRLWTFSAWFPESPLRRLRKRLGCCVFLQGRSLCSSCCGRRMADTAAHLVVKKNDRLLERRGLGSRSDPEEADPLHREQPLLAELYSASVQGRIASGPGAGERLKGVRFQFELENEGKKAGCYCADLSGFSLHAAVCIPGKARRQLENLCRYVARPAVATERLSRLPDGRVLYRLRHPWRDGTSQVIFDPLDLIGKLAALVPRPRVNLVISRNSCSLIALEV